MAKPTKLGDLLASVERAKTSQKAGKAQAAVPAPLQAQLPFWPLAVRAMPNEILRSALFTARNRRTAREVCKAKQIAILGEGRISYTGEELRQDDESVWLQLLHLARGQAIGEPVEFTPYSFCKSIGWALKGQSYARLRDSLTRMQATGLSIHSKRLAEAGVSLSMIPAFTWRDEGTGESLARWRVRLAPELVELFGDVAFSHLEWEQRKALPDGLATWLHGYLASHREPYPVKLEAIQRGAGLATTSKAEARKLVTKALDGLVAVGFLAEWKVQKDVYTVTRIA